MKKIESCVGDATFVSEIDESKWGISKKWADTTHFHVDSELHIILKGDALIEIDGEEVNVSEGDICLLAPHSSHYPKSNSDTLEKINFYFSIAKNYRAEKNFQSFSEYTLYSNIFKSVKKYFIINNTQLASIAQKLVSEKYSMQNEHIFSAHLALFYITLASCIREHLIPESRPLIRESAEGERLFNRRKIVEEFFQKRYDEDVGIDDLAKELCLSSPHTHRIVKHVFNDGFKKTLMKQRIDHACMLIKQGGLTLNNIAYRCGYTSYNGFLAAFKIYTGKTPKEYEKSVR